MSAPPTRSRGPLDRQAHCAQQAGGPRHPSTDEDSQTRSGWRSHVRPRPARSRPRPSSRSRGSCPAGSPARPRSDAAPPAAARRRDRGPRSRPGSGPPAAPPPAAPEPTGSPSSSLMCTKPCPHASLDQAARHEAADREVRVQAVPARMPLRHPHIRQCAPPQARRAARGRTRARSRAQRPRIVAALAAVGQCAEPVEPVRGPVAADLRPRPPRRLLLRALDVRRPIRRRDHRPPHRQTATALRGFRVERERPQRLNP